MRTGDSPEWLVRAAAFIAARSWPTWAWDSRGWPGIDAGSRWNRAGRRGARLDTAGWRTAFPAEGARASSGCS